jgi:hypothetical protein
MLWRRSAGTFGAMAHRVGSSWVEPSKSFWFSNGDGGHAANADRDLIDD